MGLKISGKVSLNQNFYNFIRPLLSVWFKYAFNFKTHIPEEVRKLEPPYLLLPNHQGFWDPFMAGVKIKHHIFYITSDAVFRYPLLEFFMKLLGAIPKKKAQSDFESIKHIMKIRDAGGVIGVFPEGRRTWDGTTLPLIYSTSKLIKILKIPVVTAVFKGGYFSQPRWGKHIQRGEVTLDYSVLFYPPEIKSLDSDTIHRKLTEALYFDEIEYQKTKRQVFKGRNPAENMEQAVYMCPSCGSVGTLKSSKDTVICSGCGYGVRYNKLREFEGLDGDAVFSNIRDWIRWQDKKLKELISSDTGNSTVLLRDNNLTVETGFKDKRMKHLFTGSIYLTSGSLVIKSSKGDDTRSFPVKSLKAVNIQNKEKLDFYAEGVLYNIYDRKKRFSAYKWLVAIQHIQETH